MIISEKFCHTDDAGNGYLVDKEGNIKKTTTADALAAGAKANREYSTDPNLKVIFSRADDTKYGFDEPQTVLPQNYQQTEAGDKVAWKALATGLPDNVVAASQGTGGIANATFKLGQNPQVPSPNTLADGQVQLTLIGKADGTIEEQLAYYPNPDTSKTDLVAGKLNVVSYDLVNKNLVLITVNATTTTLAPNSLQTELNNIYSQGVVQWTVNSTQSINVNGIDENALDDGGSGLLSNYTEDMKKILRAYTADHAMVSDTYYLFLVKNATSQSKLGYMPRKKQAGFIFVDAHNNSDIVKSIAHELGHGAFHLKHTFSEYPSLSQGVTENLMDYPAKTRLDKWQWDHIHNPEGVLGLFEGDDEGASLCTWWYRNITSYIWPSEQDKILEEREPLFVHIKENFDNYFAASQTDNKDIAGYTGWSARKSSFSKKSNLTLVERVIKKFIDESKPSFELFDKGIFLSEYTIEGKKYQVALYSDSKSTSFEKTQVDGLCALVDHETVKIILEDSYILVSFFNNRELQLTLQILANQDDDAELWLKYLGILLEGKSISDRVMAFWNDFFSESSDEDFILEVEQLKKLYPKVDEKVMKSIFQYINEYKDDFGIDDCNKLIHFLTQADHESGGFVYMKEIQTFSGEREKYKGREIFQLTFKSNYVAFQNALKEMGIEADIENKPELIEEAKYAVLSALWYWKRNNLSNYAKDLSMLSLLNISKLVNCGNLKYCGCEKDDNGDCKYEDGKKVKCTDCAPNGWDDRKKRFDKHKEEINCKK